DGNPLSKTLVRRSAPRRDDTSACGTEAAGGARETADSKPRGFTGSAAARAIPGPGEPFAPAAGDSARRAPVRRRSPPKGFGALHAPGIEPYVDVPALAVQVRESARSDLDRDADAEDPKRERIRATEIAEGRPAESIVTLAREAGAGLIVMGTHGRTGLSRLF